MSTETEVRRHFDADAHRFDAIYDDNKSPVARWIDNVWRGVVRRRLQRTLEFLHPLDGQSILDVGCGSGRYCVAYARGGAAQVVGVDFAARMIELACAGAAHAGVAGRCEFRAGTFPEAVPDGPFDAVTALGFFDYIADPLAMIRAMRERCRRTLVMSFPKAWEWRAPIRRLRFWFNRCPLFLYTQGKVRTLLQEAGINQFDWINLDRDYLIVAHVER
jgi:2-polyprenyl-3-methyl-5-hydroxy-6-metoxy-1,4-benzoquinol methylase